MAVSLVIFGYLCLQTMASFGVNWRFSSYTWPFIDYPMYSQAHYDGEYVEVRPLVFGVLDDGTEVPILPSDLGLNFWKFYGFAYSILHADEGPWFREGLENAVRIYQLRHGRILTTLRVDSYPAVLSRDGLKPAPSRTLKIVHLQSTTEKTR